MIPPELGAFVAPIHVLDRGFLRLIRVDGGDGSIVEAATTKGRSAHVWCHVGPPEDAVGECAVCGEPWVGAANYPTCLESDRRLIRTLMRRKHLAPFAFAAVTVRIRCPVSMLAALTQHFQICGVGQTDMMQQTAPAAWSSAAWPAGWTTGPGVGPAGEAPGDYYAETDLAVIDAAGDTVGHASSPGDYLTQREAWHHQDARELHQERRAFGVTEEQARKDLPLSAYVDVLATARVHDLLPFLASSADVVQSAYASALAEIVKVWIPHTWEAFVDYWLNAVTFSGPEMQALRNFFDGAKPGRDDLDELLDVGCLLDMINGADPARVTAQERVAFLEALGLESA